MSDTKFTPGPWAKSPHVDPGDGWQREFTMRIPAEPDRDADLVMAEAAKRLREMEGEQ